MLPDPRGSSLGALSLSAKDSPPRTSRKSRESGKEKGPGGPEILNPSNNDYWVGGTRVELCQKFTNMSKEHYFFISNAQNVRI